MAMYFVTSTGNLVQNAQFQPTENNGELQSVTSLRFVIFGADLNIFYQPTIENDLCFQVISVDLNSGFQLF